MNTVDQRGIPRLWLLIFHTTTGTRWMDRLIPGRFKHVSAACWLEDPGVWVFYDCGIRGTAIKVLDLDAGDVWLARVMQQAVTIRVMSRNDGRMVVPIGGWCVPQIKRLIGRRGMGALPDQLYRDLMRENAEVIHEVTGTAGAVC